ncbi:MAG TPA: argininosuccinate lyase, partial [Blastocatellia bacterium]|nr:argininosuccinate lyase [Blastocatellia bacterium]
LAGQIVLYALDRGKELAGLSIEEFAGFSKLIGEDVYEALTLEASLANRPAPGGTSPGRVGEELARVRAELNALRN